MKKSISMHPNFQMQLQPLLENDQIILSPLLLEDFAELYTVASDPKIWEQHPNQDRWKEDIFMVFFEGAMKSGGAFKIIDKSTHQIIGSTRFYDYDESNQSILIGYTFYGTASWGKGINLMVKAMMLDYIFQFVNNVYFHIGAYNIRSQMAIHKLGATKIGEEEVTYFGESPKLNYIYRITKDEWTSRPLIAL